MALRFRRILAPGSRPFLSTICAYLSFHFAKNVKSSTMAAIYHWKVQKLQHPSGRTNRTLGNPKGPPSSGSGTFAQRPGGIFSAEGKLRNAPNSLRGKNSIADLCRKEAIAQIHLVEEYHGSGKASRAGPFAPNAMTAGPAKGQTDLCLLRDHRLGREVFLRTAGPGAVPCRCGERFGLVRPPGTPT